MKTFCAHCNKKNTTILTDYHTKVCTNCGYETVHISTIERIHCSYSQQHSPFYAAYSRERRFKDLLEQLFYPRLTYLDNNICNFLRTVEIISSTAELFRILKKVKLKDKRYCSVHALSKQFCKDYRAPPLVDRRVVLRFCSLFSEIEIHYLHIYKSCQFFNYSWLISKFLIASKLCDFIPYVKPLKCKIRVNVYRTKLITLLDQIMLSPTNTNRELVGGLLKIV